MLTFSLSLSVPVLFLLYLEGHEEQHGGHKRVQSFSLHRRVVHPGSGSRALCRADLKLIQEEQEESRRVAEAKKESLEQEKKKRRLCRKKKADKCLPRPLTEARARKRLRTRPAREEASQRARAGGETRRRKREKRKLKLKRTVSARWARSPRPPSGFARSSA